MIITSTNRDVAILTDLVGVLGQIKQAIKANRVLVIDHAYQTACVAFDPLGSSVFDTLIESQFDALFETCADSGLQLDFYTDKAKTVLAFSDDTGTSPSRFAVEGHRTLYTPPDSLINAANGISTTKAQRIYYVTATFGDGEVRNLVYKNGLNLAFQNVIVASKVDPKYAPNESVCVIVPAPQKAVNTQANDDRTYVVLDYDLYLYLNVFDWGGLSENERNRQASKVENLIRTALLADRYRAGNATFYDKNVNGTHVGQLQIIPSKTQMKAKLKVRCAFVTDSTGY